MRGILLCKMGEFYYIKLHKIYFFCIFFKNCVMMIITKLFIGPMQSFIVDECDRIYEWRKDKDLFSIGDHVKFKTIVTGYTHSFAFDYNGKLWAWGDNKYNEILIDEDHSSAPVMIDNYLNFIKIVCGTNHTFGITDNGTIYSWGANEYGQLGIGYINRCEKFPIIVSKQIKSKKIISRYGFTFVRTHDDKLYAWGNNNFGAISMDESRESVPVPRIIPNADRFRKIFDGIMHIFTFDVNNNIWAWGLNSYGQLGLGFRNERKGMTKLKNGQAYNFTKIVCGLMHSLALDKHDRVWSWGRNIEGQLGNGNGVNIISVPSMIKIDVKIKNITCGTLHSFAIDDKGTLLSWGYNREYITRVPTKTRFILLLDNEKNFKYKLAKSIRIDGDVLFQIFPI